MKLKRITWQARFALRTKKLSALQGKIIVFEGIDGSGKETQYQLFVNHLKRLRVPCQTFDFPRYKKSLGGKALSMILSGELGVLPSEIPAKVLSLFYGIDRGEASKTLQQAQQKGYVIVLNRYITSNKGHQSWKTDNQEEYLAWIEQVEHGIFGVPREDIVIFLDMSLKNVLKLIAKRARENDKTEIDQDYLAKSLKTYRMLAQKYSHWLRINCQNQQGKLLPPELIHRHILEEISHYLKKR